MTSLEGEGLNWTLWTNMLEFCFNSASSVKIMMFDWSATMVFHFLVELIDSSLAPSVPMGTVLDTLMARWFGG